MRLTTKDIFTQERPYSWSSHSAFSWSKEEWFNRYILGKKTPPTQELIFGKMMADSFATSKPLAPVVLYPSVEHELRASLNDIPLVGYIDTYHPEEKKLREYKTGKWKGDIPAWDQAKVDSHGQLTMYGLLLYLQEKTHPKDVQMHLDWLPTKQDGDFSISLVDPAVIHTFETKRTMAQLLDFGAEIQEQLKAMDEYMAFRFKEDERTVE